MQHIVPAYSRLGGAWFGYVRWRKVCATVPVQLNARRRHGGEAGEDTVASRTAARAEFTCQLRVAEECRVSDMVEQFASTSTAAGDDV